MIFALVALVFAVVFTSCEKNDDFKVCTISVTNVSEHVIGGKCVYAPSEKLLGYNMFLAYTNNVTEQMREIMINAYEEKGAQTDNTSFLYDKLSSNQKYYLLAVTYKQDGEKVGIHSIEFVQQATMANNASNVTIGNASDKDAEFFVTVLDESYNEEEFPVYKDADDKNFYSATVEFIVMNPEEVIDETETNCFDGKALHCKYAWNDISVNDSKSATFYGMTDDKSGKYKAIVTVYHRDITSMK